MPAKFKPQFRRLMFIDQKIRDGKGREVLPNCSTLAEEYEVSPKTIQRDLEFLKWEVGAPLEYDPIRHGYYYTEDNYMLPALRIAESDLFAICIAEKVLRQYEGTPLHERLRGVFEKIGECLPDKVSVDPGVLDDRFSFLPEAVPRINPRIWDRSFEALRLGRTLDIRYQIPSRDKPYDNRVDPYHIAGHRGDWYLVGHCHYKDALRVFSMARIQKATLSKDTFRIPKDFDFRKQWKDRFGIMAGAGTYLVKIRFSKDQAPYVRERTWHPTQKLRPVRGGGVELSFTANHLFEVTRWVLSWGAGAEVLDPPELREQVRKEHETALERYAKPS